MSQEQRNSTTAPNEPTTLTQRESDEVSVLSSIEKRLIEADNPQDIVLWTQVRGEIIRQNEGAKNQKHQRSSEKRQVWYKMVFSVSAFVVGIGMLIGGLTYLGLFISGAGLFGFVPDYVKALLRIFREKGRGGENAEE
ncbi:hypothetical protein J4G02_07560 [Candidatus Poribacteria bacterium]|nr:hypothetical protein [Candidatus Poribacteria bacterium]